MTVAGDLYFVWDYAADYLWESAYVEYGDASVAGLGVYLGGA